MSVCSVRVSQKSGRDPSTLPHSLTSSLPRRTCIETPCPFDRRGTPDVRWTNHHQIDALREGNRGRREGGREGGRKGAWIEMLSL